ncbi:MAG TPA: hypothetical protein IAA29_20480 [Candidatus Paenibacillus intestinavium]|nr:hypothetical protein [Candidatus Paenibacillus intestinavium]
MKDHKRLIADKEHKDEGILLSAGPDASGLSDGGQNLIISLDLLVEIILIGLRHVPLLFQSVYCSSLVAALNS